MSRVGGKNTKPELAVRRALHALGYRFRIHRPDLPGRPDIVLPRYRVAIFVHGCFWHRHSGCGKASLPKTRTNFWNRKFEANVARDERNRLDLAATGWRVFTIWECETRTLDETMARLHGEIQRIGADDALLQHLK